MTAVELTEGLLSISEVPRGYRKVTSYCDRKGIKCKSIYGAYWTPAVEKYIRKHTPGKSFAELIEGLREKKLLTCHQETIRSRCKAEGIKLKCRQLHHWSPEEKKYIQDSYGKKRTSVMARELELSYKSVAAQVHKMFQRQKSGVKLKEITGWMNSMLERVEPNGKSIYDLSVEFHNQGRIVEIPSNNQGQIMLLASDGR